MKDTIGLILLALALTYFYAPQHIGLAARAVVDGYTGEGCHQ
jgi:hypothetical protein